MTSQSIYKHICDEYVADFFQSQGWNSQIVNKKGWFCDVIAVRNSEVAIIEVKSPCEQSCGSNYDDTKAMTDSSLRSLPANFSNWRKLIFNGISDVEHLSLTKLFAISIACQLFRYLHEHNEKIEKYEQAIGNYLKHPQLYRLIPYFAAPIEEGPQADYALNYLKTKKYILDYSTQKTCRLYVARITYNRSCVCIHL